MEYNQTEERPEKKSDAAFVLGLLSIVFVVVCQIVGLILGIVGLKKAKKSSDTGWVLSVIGIVLNAVIIAFVIIGLVIAAVIIGSVFSSPYYYW